MNMNSRATGTVRSGVVRRNLRLFLLFVVGFLCAVVVRQGAVASTAQAQEEGMAWDAWCWKVRVCGGVSAQGLCMPQGFSCGSWTCTPEGAPFNGCSWTYVWSCLESCNEVCFWGSQQEMSTNCGPNCRLLSPNQCACECQNLGAGTSEGGPYNQCW